MYWDVWVGFLKKPTTSIFRGEKWIYNCHHEDWRRSAAVYLLRLWIRILQGTWKFVYRDSCVLSGRGLCDELITRPEESYRMCVCVCVCDLETSGTRRSRPDLCGCTTKSVISAGNNRTRYLVIVWEQQEFPPPRRPNWLWGPSSFLLNGYRGSFSRVEWPRREPNHQTLYLAPRFRRNRAITLLPCTHSWHKQEKITNHDRSSDADIEKEATINWTLR